MISEEISQDLTANPESKRAKRIAFQYLKVRNRSEKEIRVQLRKKEIAQAIIEQTVEYLKKLNLINDQQFARDWISTRVKKPLGLRRIFFELKEKGIDEGVLAQELSEARSNSNEEDVVARLAAKRLLRYHGLDQRTQKRRIFEYLIRRGFTPAVVTRIVEGL